MFPIIYRNFAKLTLIILVLSSLFLNDFIFNCVNALNMESRQTFIVRTIRSYTFYYFIYHVFAFVFIVKSLRLI